MKAKKFLKIIKKVCIDNNCVVGKCPMAYARKGEKYSSCLMMAESVPCDWDIDAIITAVKRYKLGDILELEERKHGRIGLNTLNTPIGDCSVCGERVPIYSGSKKYKICPYCGAIMNGDNDD